MSSWFIKGKNFFGTGDIDFLNDDILAILIDKTKYSPDYNNHTFISDIPEGARIASALLTSKRMENRVAFAATTVLPSVEYTGPIGAVILAKDTTDEASSPIFLLADQGNFPLTPDGEDVLLQWADTGIFVL